tara:strand:- start:120 stop:584 length:465 start_codon:yes stop_codon:yes gene_type:complete
MSLLITGASFHNQDDLVRQLADVFEQWVRDDVNGDYMDEQFLDRNRWQYPPPSTKRKSGDTAGNPRDIYDLGKLYESGKRSFTVKRTATKIEASWHWNAKNQSGDEYAWFVHEGEGPYSRAPRPWTDEIAVPYLFYGSNPHKRLEESITLKMGR